MKHPSDEQFVLLHYRELDEAETLAMGQHLTGCDGCRRRLASLERELAAVRPLPVPERPEDYGARVWARLQPRLAAERAGTAEASRWWHIRIPSFRPLAYAAGIAVLVLAAFVAGRYWAPGPASNQAGAGAPAAGVPASASASPAPAERVRERILVLEVGEHLERSQAALLEVMNAAGEDGAIDLSSDQVRVRELVSENRLYRLTALDVGENGMAAVLDELERALVEIANSPSRVSEKDFERVRGEIDAQGLVFKVGILGDTLRQRSAKDSSST